ncbi:MAG: hypothetical protein KAT85_11235 [candidate division Zixibacteria bacterium]|jgi:hypothetical protein|nr:hypothetical protein [candidate division Zixibacteria bacterium]
MQFRRFLEILTQRLLIPGTIILLVSLLALSVGCGKDKETEEGTDTSSVGERVEVSREYFANWLRHSSKVFELRYPQNEELHGRIEGIGQKLDTIVVFNAMYFSQRPPDKIYVMMFPNKFEAEEVLGREVPFVSGDTIFYEMFAPLGTGITELMLNRVNPGGSKFAFVNEGLPTLLDFSGEDYHEKALGFIESGEAIPVADMVDNDKYTRMPRQLRREQAASFLGFLSYNYGPKPIIGLLKQDISANGILTIATKKNLNILEAEWKNDLPRLAALDSLETQP